MKDLLVGAVRDAALQMVTDDPDRIEEVVGELESRRWMVFRRITLDVLQEPGTAGLLLAGKRLADQNLAAEHSLDYEYLQLLSAVFPDLSDDCKRRVMATIDTGPDTNDLREDLDTSDYVSGGVGNGSPLSKIASPSNGKTTGIS